MFEEVSDIRLVNGLLVTVANNAGPIGVRDHLVQQRHRRNDAIQLAAGKAGFEEGDDVGEFGGLEQGGLMESEESKEELVEEDPRASKEGIEVVGLQGGARPTMSVIGKRLANCVKIQLVANISVCTP